MMRAFSLAPGSTKPLFRPGWPQEEQVRKSAPKNVWGKISSPVSAERTLRHNPAIRHGLDRSRNVLAAALAPDRVVTDLRFGKLPHSDSIGEETAKICTGIGEPDFLLIPYNHALDKHASIFRTRNRSQPPTDATESQAGGSEFPSPVRQWRRLSVEVLTLRRREWATRVQSRHLRYVGAE